MSSARLPAMPDWPGRIDSSEGRVLRPFKGRARQLILLVQLGVVALSAFAIWSWVPDTLDSLDKQSASDFPNFNGAALLVREGFGDELYDRTPEPGADLVRYCDAPPEAFPDALTFAGPADACRALKGNFRSPPSVLFLYIPLSYAGHDLAYEIAFFVLAAASIALAAWTASYFSSWPARLAVALAILALPILQLALRLSQPSAIYALALLAGFILDRRKRPTLAGAAFAIVSMKPQFLVLPMVLLAVNGSTRTVVWTAIFSSAAFLAGAALVGPQAMIHYFELNFELLTDGPALLQEAWMYNWQGFALALTGEPQRLPAAMLSLATLLALGVVWMRRLPGIPAITIATSLLAAPYVLFYDWIILAAAGALAACALTEWRQRVWLGVIMLLVAGGVWATQDDLPVFGNRSGGIPSGVIYWSTASLALALMVAAVAFEAFRATPGGQAAAADRDPRE
jgi:Glycosyltransferase family 87